MENLINSLSGTQIAIQPQLADISQEQLTVAQQLYIDYIDKGRAANSPETSTVTQELEIKMHEFTELLRKNKEQAQITISQLVSSANCMTADLKAALTAVPVHPYEKLIHEYLGPNFICPSITDLTIPKNFCAQQCLGDLEAIVKDVGELQTNQFNLMSAEAMDTSFYGITSENLNNAFAILSSTPNGNQYVIDNNRLAEHLKFVETVKSIPVDYVLKNPLEVAKKMISEFVRINHKTNTFSP